MSSTSVTFLQDKDNDEDTVEEQPRKKKRKSLKRRFNVFCHAWMEVLEFRNWLVKAERKNNVHEMALCKACECLITAHKNDIFRHSLPTKHKSKIKQISSSHKIDTLLSTTPLEKSVRRAELKPARLSACNKLPFKLMDTLGPLCSDLFPDSHIAKKCP